MEQCAHCRNALPRMPRQALADGTLLCKPCWRAYNGLGGPGRPCAIDPRFRARMVMAQLTAQQTRWY